MSTEKDISFRLEKLADYVRILKELKKKTTFKDINADPILQGALERYLQLAAESAIDIGEMIIAEKGFSVPHFNRDVFEILGKEKVIPEALAKSLGTMASFRNILVHDYLEIDLKKVYAFVQNELSDLEKFLAAIARYLKKS